VSLRLLDLTERVIVLFSYLLSTIVLVYEIVRRPSPGTALLLASDLLVVVFVIFRRRPRRMSVRPSDWFIAVLGTVAPLFMGPPDGLRPGPRRVATVVIVLGLVMSVLAKLTLRFNFSVVPARTGIVVRGPYRLVRHPMYSGYVLNQVGLLLYGFTARNLLCCATCWICLWVRIGREEALLVDDERYRTYRGRVRYRLLWGVV
jgi:protein-S-isoprenylcysteine O-methyltransferase Ste14